MILVAHTDVPSIEASYMSTTCTSIFHNKDVDPAKEVTARLYLVLFLVYTISDETPDCCHSLRYKHRSIRA